MEIYKGNSKCWRNYGKNMQIIYTFFYTCKVIQTFWKEVIKILEHIFKNKLELRTENILFGKILANITSEEKYLSQILRVAMLKMITREWKKVIHQKLRNG